MLVVKWGGHSLTRHAQLCLFVTPWTVAPLFMGFSRQEYWSRLPFFPLGDIPDWGTKPVSPVSYTAGRFFTAEPLGKPKVVVKYCFVLFFLFVIGNHKNILFIYWNLFWKLQSLIQFTSVAQLCPTLCNPWTAARQASLSITIPQSLLKLTSIKSFDAIQPSHPLSSPSPPAFNLSQHQGLFKWVSTSQQVAKVLDFLLQHHSFQWIFRTDFL